MNGILLAGLTDHEAAAIEILIGMHWRAQRSGWHVRSQRLQQPAPGPLPGRNRYGRRLAATIKR